MTDTSSAVAAIQGWIANVNGAFSALPNELDSPTSSTDFQSVFEQLQGLFSPEGASTASTTASSAGVTAGQQALLSQALSATSTTSPTGADVVNEAQQYLGVPYVWGGTSPSGFDCSGFVQYVYNQLGVSLPRTSEEQATVGTPVTSLAAAQPGDLLFFAGSDGTAASPGHVGIYLGNGQMIDAPETGMNVSVQPVSSAGAVVAIRDVLSDPSTGAASPATTGASTSSSSVPSDLAPLFAASAQRYGVPENLLTSVAQVESGFNPNATSSAGAEGLMQLMPATAQTLGVDPLDPAEAINGAAQLLSSYLQTFHSTPLALAAYNAGAGAVEQYGGIPPYPETQQYVQAVMANIGATS